MVQFLVPPNVPVLEEPSPTPAPGEVYFDTAYGLRTFDGQHWVSWASKSYVDAQIVVLQEALRTIRSGKDDAGIFTVLEWRRVSDDTLAARSELSGEGPEYPTRTVTEYEGDGTTVARATVYTLIYDDGELVEETVA